MNVSRLLVAILLFAVSFVALEGVFDYFRGEPFAVGWARVLCTAVLFGLGWVWLDSRRGKSDRAKQS